MVREDLKFMSEDRVYTFSYNLTKKPYIKAFRFYLLKMFGVTGFLAISVIFLGGLAFYSSGDFHITLHIFLNIYPMYNFH